MKVLIIIPAYNESKNIVSVITDINKNLSNPNYIIINDCSTDETALICKKNEYNVINLPINLGIGGCVQTGYKYALENNFNYAVQFDGDGQHSAKYIPILLDCMITEQADMVIGSRFISMQGFQSTFMRRFGINLLSLTIKCINGIRITDPTSGFRMVNEDVIKIFCDYYPSDYPEPESTSDIIKRGYKVKEIPVIMCERVHGTSSIDILKSMYYMPKVVLAILIGKAISKKKKEK